MITADRDLQGAWWYRKDSEPPKTYADMVYPVPRMVRAPMGLIIVHPQGTSPELLRDAEAECMAAGRTQSGIAYGGAAWLVVA